jgi:hypothetical protein
MRNTSQWSPHIALHTPSIYSPSFVTRRRNISFIRFAVASLVLPGYSLFGFHTSERKKVKRRKVRRTGRPRGWSSSSNPATWEIHTETVTDTVSETNERAILLKNKIIVEMRRNKIFRHVQEWIACSSLHQRKTGRWLFLVSALITRSLYDYPILFVNFLC